MASQSFGLAPAPAEDPELAAQQVVFSLSFDSDEYDETGAVTYPNGAHNIVAGLTVQGSTEEAFSNRMEVEFKNSSFVAASVSGLGDGAMNSRTGQVWYGGPDASVEISALPVWYSSGAAVSSVTLLSFCGDDAATDSEAPFSFEVDCGGFQGSDTPSFNVGGAEIDSKGGKVYLDFKAPDAPYFQPTPTSVRVAGSTPPSASRPSTRMRRARETDGSSTMMTVRITTRMMVSAGTHRRSVSPKPVTMTKWAERLPRLP